MKRSCNTAPGIPLFAEQVFSLEYTRLQCHVHATTTWNALLVSVLSFISLRTLSEACGIANRKKQLEELVKCTM